MNGESFDTYCQRRWGGSHWTDHLRKEGRKDGCNFQNWKYISNTIRAHQLIRYGTKYHLSHTSTDTMNAALFQALYEDGENISNIDTLVTLGSQLFGSGTGTTEGTVDIDHLRTYLEQHQGRDEVLSEITKLQKKYTVRGVPSFHIGIVQPNMAATAAINDDDDWMTPLHSFSGAQPAQVFEEAFHELLEQL